MDGGEEVSCGLVVARGDGTELFESGEEIFDQMARFVEFAVERAASATIGSGRDHHSLAGRRQWLDDTRIGVKRLAINVSGCMSGNRWSAPTRSWASPPLKWKPSGLPRA